MVTAAAAGMVVVLLGASAAQAATVGLNLDPPTRYRAEVLVQNGTPVQLLGSNNLNARATMVAMALELTCDGSAAGSRGWEVACDVDTAQLQGTAITPPEQERLDTIMAEYGTLLSQATLQIGIGSDGRVRLVDVEGIEKRDERMSVVHEYIRLLVRRAFAPADVQLPKKGEAAVGERWKQKSGALPMEVFSRFGTIGGSVVTYEVLAADGAGVVVQRSGRGNIGVSSTGATMGFEDGSQETPTGQLYNTTMAGLLRFVGDSWVYGEYTTQGTLNQATSSLVEQFTHAAWIGRINADGTVEGPAGPRTLSDQ